MNKNIVIIFAVIMMTLGTVGGIWITYAGNVWGIALSFLSVIFIGTWLFVAVSEDESK